MRSDFIFSPDQPEEFWIKALQWSSQFKIAACTNPNGQDFPFDPFKNIIAAGAKKYIISNAYDDFDNLKLFHDQNKEWIFGYFGYDLKNQVEPQLTSRHSSRTDHPDMFFFIPEHLIFMEGNRVRIESEEDPQVLLTKILKQDINLNPIPKAHFQHMMPKTEYLDKASAIIDHIVEGDVYELNLCMEFYANHMTLDPIATYLKLIQISPTPFSAFLKFNDHYVISASPERFLRKDGKKLISQPIKGTARRHPDKEEDEKLKTTLRDDEKERAENMMIVDLVRNDLARSAEYGTVTVEEIFGIYSFMQWHQMISTVSAEARPDIHWSDVIKNAFPMGSMTGAPKIKVMELIERYENSRRGVYSGAFGYVTPEGDFDFNVIIRSLFYNSEKEIVNFMVGSALTYDSIPEKEYEECLLKATAILQLFGDRTIS